MQFQLGRKYFDQSEMGTHARNIHHGALAAIRAPGSNFFMLENNDLLKTGGIIGDDPLPNVDDIVELRFNIFLHDEGQQVKIPAGAYGRVLSVSASDKIVEVRWQFADQTVQTVRCKLPHYMMQPC